MLLVSTRPLFRLIGFNWNELISLSKPKNLLPSRRPIGFALFGCECAHSHVSLDLNEVNRCKYRRTVRETRISHCLFIEKKLPHQKASQTRSQSGPGELRSLLSFDCRFFSSSPHTHRRPAKQKPSTIEEEEAEHHDEAQLLSSDSTIWLCARSCPTKTLFLHSFLFLSGATNALLPNRGGRETLIWYIRAVFNSKLNSSPLFVVFFPILFNDFHQICMEV